MIGHINNNNNGYGMSCHNSQIRLPHIVKPQRNARQTETKTRIL